MALITKAALKEIAHCFPPKSHYAFAYGSGVFAQKNQKAGKMIDVVFVVDDPVQWHKVNIKMNPRHYSSVRFFGSRFISYLQEKMACGVYYNPYVEVAGRMMKYGVISTSTLVRDLQNWDHLYIAGRLQKPVANLKPPGSTRLSGWVKHNRMMALRCALLQSEGITTKYQLFHNIASLSYHGDTRMYFAETPDKVKNIVLPLMNEFDKIYMPLVKELDHAIELPEGVIAQDQNPLARYAHLIQLPRRIQVSLVKAMNRDPGDVDIEEVLLSLSNSPKIDVLLTAAISNIVRTSSISQTMQGIISAGPIKSIKYGWEKLQKGLQKKKPSETVVEDTEHDHIPTTISMVIPASKVIKITKPFPSAGIKKAKITVTDRDKVNDPPPSRIPAGIQRIIRPGKSIKQVSLLADDPQGKKKSSSGLMTEHTVIKTVTGGSSSSNKGKEDGAK